MALRSEAAPLLDRFGLERLGKGSRPTLWSKNDVLLAVSGIGRAAAARAVEEAALGVGQGEPVAWLNVGVAGHRDHELGTTFLASRVEDAATGMVWFPSPDLQVGIGRAIVRTVDAPQEIYSDDVLYEMEAAAIFARASRRPGGGAIHALKIVSDNLASPIRTLTAERARRLVAEAVPAVAKCVGALRAIHRNRSV